MHIKAGKQAVYAQMRPDSPYLQTRTRSYTIMP